MSGNIYREQVFIIKSYNFKAEDVFVQLIFTAVYLNVYLSLCIKQLIQVIQVILVHRKSLFSYCHCSFGNCDCYVSGYPGRKYTHAELPALNTPLV